jgi:DNA sulfur modification protein DndB
MKNEGSTKIVLPALRGVMGEWVYYSCLMTLEELAKRVSYAEEIHNNKNLSDMIQRKIVQGRSAQIAKYIGEQKERFFNSLVVATYEGNPNWHALANVRLKHGKSALSNLTEGTMASVGFLTLEGSEILFALDGQHRLAGIKKAVKDGLAQERSDEVSVIFVAHEATKTGLARTRRLFTTLNKTARPVSKGDIIALDEDDVMAISIRWLIEEERFFTGDKLAFVASNNMPVANSVSLTTIGNLYDVLSILFSETKWEFRKKKSELQRVRPTDECLTSYFQLATEYFSCMEKYFSETREFFKVVDTRPVVTKYRGSHGGSAMFRPIGLEIFTRIIAKLTNSMSLAAAVKLAARLPRDLDKAPFAGLLWDLSNRTISSAHKVTLRQTLLYMIGHSEVSVQKLTERYRRETGNENARLPKPVVG